MLCAVTCPHPWHGIDAPKRSPATPVPTCPSSVPPWTRSASRTDRPTATTSSTRTGTRRSPGRAGPRDAREAAQRSLTLPVAAADMRALPFADAAFDAVVCADNALPHLLTAEDVRAALAETRRVLRPGGPLLLSTRPCGELLRIRPRSGAPRVRTGPDGRIITFQLLPAGDTWAARTSSATYWALPQERTAAFARQAGLHGTVGPAPADTGFPQPVLTARRPGPTGQGD
ncbi:class I SAM-dependent methyltransferase [Streptomyces sp. NC-S4]